MGYQTLLVDRAGVVATITLNRPDARNALDIVMRRELVAALDEVEADPRPRACSCSPGPADTSGRAGTSRACGTARAARAGRGSSCSTGS